MRSRPTRATWSAKGKPGTWKAWKRGTVNAERELRLTADPDFRLPDLRTPGSTPCNCRRRRCFLGEHHDSVTAVAWLEQSRPASRLQQASRPASGRLTSDNVKQSDGTGGSAPGAPFVLRR